MLIVVLLVIVAVSSIVSYDVIHSKHLSSSSYTTVAVTQFGPMTFTGFCEPCSYDNVYSYSLSQLEQDVSMLKGLGVTQIRIDLGFDPWLSNNQTAIQKDVSIIDYIKSQGLSLVIADASAERYRNFPLPWTDFKVAWASRVHTLAQAFQPSYYLIIKEPGWYVPMVSDSRTNPNFQSALDWLNLTSWLSSAVSSVSPNTKMGVSVCSNCIYKNSNFYVPLLTELPTSISFVGFDTYGQGDNVAMQNFLGNYSIGGRAIWNAEAWSQSSSSSDPQTDPNWLAAQYEFDLSKGVFEMMPFYTNDFVAYSTTSPTTFVASTPVAKEFQVIIANS